MKNPSFRNCPLCQVSDHETIHALACGNFDYSKLYSTIRVNHCFHCGHIFNELSQDELKGLNNYLNIEYAPANLNAIDMDGDRAGSVSNLSANRYSQLCSVLSAYIQYHHEILDVGCAMGGFLDYLNQKGFNHLSGVDMLETYIEHARVKNQYRIKFGNVESLPFGNRAFDVVVMDQVFEHLANPIKAFQETKRVLKNGGILCIGVPDASRYSDFYFFDFYWFLLREHIQHFDVDHLSLVALREGFEMLECRHTALAVMSERMIMPNLYVVFRLTGSVPDRVEKDFNNANLYKQMTDYINKEKSRQSIKSRKIAELSKSRKPVYVWGIGREFFYLYEAVGLKDCNIVGLIDGNHFKQKSCTVNGMKIVDAGVLLRNASVDSVLLITAIAHVDFIKHSVASLGFKGKIFNLEI